MQFAQSSIAQLEKTRSLQQAQITSLQTQTQTLEVTIQTLGKFLAELAQQNPNVEFPGEVLRILQNLDDLESQRRKPLFTEQRKIGKSVSVNSHLGFPLKVLEELSEKDEHGSPQKRKTEKTPFFEHTYEQLRQQQQLRVQMSGYAGQNSPSPTRQSVSAAAEQPVRPNTLLSEEELKLPEHVDKFISNIKSPLELDSGVGTPLSPPSSSSSISSSSVSTANSSGGLFSRMGYKNVPKTLSPHAQRQNPAAGNIMAEMTSIGSEESQHPLSMVGGDVNVKFNGTTQLKSIKPMHHMRPSALSLVSANNNNNMNANAGSSNSDSEMESSNNVLTNEPAVVGRS